jgi:hypothetical protein
MTRLEALLEIGQLLAPRAKRLPAEVTAAFTDARAYLTAKLRRKTGLHEALADKRLPWLALIRALADAGACAAVDWRASAPEIERALARLGAPRSAIAWMKRQDDDAETSTEELLEMAGEKLRARGVRLGYLDDGSDSYALVLLAPESVAKVKRLALRARYGRFGALGDRVAAARRERVARAKVRARPVRVRKAPTAKRPQYRGPDRNGVGIRLWRGGRFFLDAKAKLVWCVSGALQERAVWRKAVALESGAPGEQFPESENITCYYGSEKAAAKIAVALADELAGGEPVEDRRWRDWIEEHPFKSPLKPLTKAQVIALFA